MERSGECAIHSALTAVMAWLAVVLMMPGSTFGTGAGYAMLARLASEEAWAMVFWAVASTGLVGLATSSRLLRLGCVLVLATAHGMLATCFALGSPSSTASGTYAVLAGLGYFLAWRRTDEGL